MTKQEWMACTDAEAMIDFLEGKVSNRKMLLIAWTIWRTSWLPVVGMLKYLAVQSSKGIFALLSGEKIPPLFTEWDARGFASRKDSSYFIRDIVGNPFCVAIIKPTWRTSTVISLAETIYQERAFNRLPILADSLEEAGCDNAEILNHCRQPREHVRGCFVVDLVLGKA